MERRKTWFIACLTLLGLAVLSFLTYSDVSAYKFPIDYVPLNFPCSFIGNNQFTSCPGFTITTNQSIDEEDFYPYLSQIVVSASPADLPGNNCAPYSYQRYPYLAQGPTMGNIDTFTTYFSFPGYSYAPPFEYNVCQTVNQLPNYESVLFSQYDSLVPRIERPIIHVPSQNLPYRMSYNGIYFNSHFKNDHGLDFDTKFDLNYNLFDLNNYPTEYFQVTLPLGPSNPGAVSYLPSNTNVDFYGEFVITTEQSVSEFYIQDASDITITLQTYYISGDQYNEADNNICDVSMSYDDPNDPFSAIGLKYHCKDTWIDYESIDYSEDSSIPFFVLVVDFPGHPSARPNSTQMQNFIVEDMYFVTNWDFTDAPTEFNQLPSGSEPGRSPGSGEQGLSDADLDKEPNFFNSLFKLFDFNLINPFSPIFAMFTDNSACVNIPIIAGMIHSNETQVCPWFDSTTRGIVTPVLGIASIMLLFGFAVRWLGARSGNFFEDSTDGFESGGIHVGRRSKK